MNMTEHFFSIRTTETDKANFDVRVLQAGTLINWVEVVEYLGERYFVGHAMATAPLPKIFDFDTYQNVILLSKLKEEKVSQVKANQAAAYLRVEGENDINLRKAEATAHTEASFHEYDYYHFMKKEIRAKGNAMEGLVNAYVTYEDLSTLDVTLDLNWEPEIKFNAITVGSFIARFTADESSAIKLLRQENEGVDKSYSALLGRTHVNVTTKELISTIQYFNQEGVLEAEPLDPSFASRVDELLSKGDYDSAWRPMLS